MSSAKGTLTNKWLFSVRNSNEAQILYMTEVHKARSLEQKHDHYESKNFAISGPGQDQLAKTQVVRKDICTSY